jgi:hypothetical protein
MLGDLLKQLAVALPKFIWYQFRRPFLPATPKSTQPPPPSEVVPAIESLNNYIGLDASYLSLVPWTAYRNDIPGPEVLSDPLYQLWTSTSGGRKWSHYFWIYQAIFEPIRHKPLRILEIGVMLGSSQKLWKRYFDHPQTQIVGIDIDPKCRELDAPQNGTHVRIGNQADPDFLKSVVAEFGAFDLIIDDGSHVSSHIIASFNHLFASGLKDSGIYFVEDLHANYWPGWRDSRKSFLDVCKELLEHMNGHYQRWPQDAFLVLKPSDQPAEALYVPRITTMIKEMRFFDSIVAIYKAKLENIPYMLHGE